MHSLATLQSDVTKAMFAGNLAHVSGAFAANRGSSTARLNIYRNNTFTSLTEALKANFPMTVRMVDERFFRYAANAFISQHPPREPRLSAYGAAFPQFLARFTATRDLPVIAELAALEWAIVRASTMAEREPAPVALLQRLGATSRAPVLTLQPTLTFALSRWPILEIWTAHRTEAPEAIPTFERRPTRLAVYRRDGQIRFLELSAARFAFWRRLVAGDALEAAVTRALARDPFFALVEELMLLFRCGLVTGLVDDTHLE